MPESKEDDEIKTLKTEDGDIIIYNKENPEEFLQMGEEILLEDYE